MLDPEAVHSSFISHHFLAETPLLCSEYQVPGLGIDADFMTLPPNKVHGSAGFRFRGGWEGGGGGNRALWLDPPLPQKGLN